MLKPPETTRPGLRGRLPSRPGRCAAAGRRLLVVVITALDLAGCFVGLRNAGGQSASADSARAETLGPSSRRTPLVISEVMYHPVSNFDSQNLEFVEIYNSQPWPEDISGFQLAGGVRYTFPTGTVLSAQGLLVVAADPDAVGARYGLGEVLGPWQGRLNNAGEELQLLNRFGAVLLELAYETAPPWPAAAAGAGPSLVLARPSWGEGDPRAWAASDLIGGSPGMLETIGPEPLREVMVNEVFAHIAPSEQAFVELYNHGRVPADLSGSHLTDDPVTNKFIFPEGTRLGPGGFVAVDESDLGFALPMSGGTLYLINRDRTRVLDAMRFGPQALGIPHGRSPDGSALWSELKGKTPGLANTTALTRDVVINEIMYAPLSRDDREQFVELHNCGTNSVNLSGWRFIAGIDFTFPPHTILAPGGYLVVARNLARLLKNYSHLCGTNVVGDFGGSLSGRGERLVLAMPELVMSATQSEPTTNYVAIDEVIYGTGGNWGRWSDGGGSSLELVDPRSDNRLPDNWADSDETAKARWTTLETTGRLEHGLGAPNALHLLLLGAGECLVDEVSVAGEDGANLLANSSFEDGLSPWTPQGNHDRSSATSEGGWNNSRCLHLRTDGTGDPGANKIRVPLTANLNVGALATIHARLRWVRGHPEILFRTAGNHFEAFGRLQVPSDLGTPGAPNSRRFAQTGPAIFDLRLEPVLPAAGQAATVTVRLDDPDGLGPAWLKYRIDPDTRSIISVPLVDDGLAEDAVAADGLYTAVIPGQAAGVLVAFHIAAQDSQGVSRLHPREAPARECLVRFGESPSSGTIGAYRLWVTQATFSNWTARLKLHNGGLDATFVYGQERAIYNVGALFAGSAYHSWRYTTPTGVACDYKLIFSEDERFLGSDEATLVWPGLSAGDPVDTTAQREPIAYWVAAELGLPFNYQRYIHVFLNGVRRSFVMQDKQKPDRDLLRQWFPGRSDGDLFKGQIWREYNEPATAVTTSISATLGEFITDGAKKTSRYRWCWTPRATGGTANKFDELFTLVDAVNSPSDSYMSDVEAVVDIEQWMRTFAAEHIVGNWDSYGYGNGQNMYAYKPPDGRWQMIIWDLDVSLGNASDGPTADLFKLTNPYFFQFTGDPAVVGRMYQTPKFARAYWRAVQDAVNGPLLSSVADARLDARAAGFAANGIAAASPAQIKSFLATRRSYCLGRLATLGADFSVTGPTSLTSSNTLLELSGTAPVEVSEILFNGRMFPITWTSVTSWTARVMPAAGTNELFAQGVDRLGNSISSARWTNIVASLLPASDPGDPQDITVAINEWMASNIEGFPNPIGGEYDDWFELYNPASEPAQLEGYFLTDNLAEPLKAVIPAGYTIPPHGYLVVWADGQPSRNSVNPSNLHVNFQLARSGDTIALYTPAGQFVDGVSFGPQISDLSQGRSPDGGAAIEFLVAATPGSPNAMPRPVHAVMVCSVRRLPSGELQLSWPTVAGRSYRVEHTPDLEAPRWLLLGNDQFASGSSLSRVDSIGPTRQRFYRVLQLVQ